MLPYLTVIIFAFTEAVTRRCSTKQVFLKFPQNLQQKNTYAWVFFNKVAETPVRVFYCKFSENFTVEHLWIGPSVFLLIYVFI